MRKKPGPKPTGKGTQVVVRCQPDLLDALDAFIAAQQPFHEKTLTRPEAVRLLMQEALAKNGLWKP